MFVSPKYFIVVISMNSRRAAARRGEEGIENAGAHDSEVPPQDNQVPPLVQVAMGDHVLMVPPPIIYGNIRDAFINFGPSHDLPN